MVRKIIVCVLADLFLACSSNPDPVEDPSDVDDGLFQYGELVDGKFEPVLRMRQPAFASLSSQGMIDHVGYGGYGRVIKRLVEKYDQTKISKATVRIIVLDSAFNRYPDIVPVDVMFYRTGETENNKYVFQTLIHEPLDPDYDPEKHGRLILFSRDPKDQGIHGNFHVIHVKGPGDNFRYEVVSW